MGKQLTKNFNEDEFACKCGCGYNVISDDLVDNLQHSREATGITYRITSGCRCVKHNRAEGGEPDSEHVTGEAADIECLDSRARYLMLQDFVRRFRRIGIGRNFIHVDVAKDAPQDVTWTYYK